MFDTDESLNYNKLFSQIGIYDEKTQKQVLDFLYVLGTIVFNNNLIKSDNEDET